MANNMDMKDLFNLNQNEMQQLAGIMSKKNNKMSKKDQNNLLSKISNIVKPEENKEISKNMSEMTNDEKIEYRNELKKKMKNKQNQMRDNRKPKYNLKEDNKKLEEKLAETINRYSVETPVNNTNNKEIKQEELDDYIVL
jgi:hypothetical protein